MSIPIWSHVLFGSMMSLLVWSHVLSRGTGARGGLVLGGLVLMGGMVLPAPHPREQTDTCKNITFPQLRLRAVTIL